MLKFLSLAIFCRQCTTCTYILVKSVNQIVCRYFLLWDIFCILNCHLKLFSWFFLALFLTSFNESHVRFTSLVPSLFILELVRIWREEHAYSKAIYWSGRKYLYFFVQFLQATIYHISVKLTGHRNFNFCRPWNVILTLLRCQKYSYFIFNCPFKFYFYNDNSFSLF